MCSPSDRVINDLYHLNYSKDVDEIVDYFNMDKNSDYYINSKVNLEAGQNFSTQKGSATANKKNYQVITSLGSQGSTTGTDLQGINGNISANYVLGSDINASATSSWNGGEGFNPLGFGNYFERTFDGLGHTISDLYISRASTNFVVDLVHVIGFQWLERIAPAIFVFKE